MSENQSYDRDAKRETLYTQYESAALLTRDRIGESFLLPGVYEKLSPGKKRLLALEKNAADIIDELIDDFDQNDESERLLRLRLRKEDQRAIWDSMVLARDQLYDVLCPPPVHNDVMNLAERMLKEMCGDRRPPDRHEISRKIFEKEVLRGPRTAHAQAHDDIHVEARRLLRLKRERNMSPENEIASRENVIKILQFIDRSRVMARQGHHRDLQLRNSGEAYFFHPEEVALLILLVHGGRPVDEVCMRLAAAYCHDIVEDTDVGIDELERMMVQIYMKIEGGSMSNNELFERSQAFAKKFVGIVKLVTEDNELKKIPKEPRELLVIKKLKHAKPEDERESGIIVKLADRIHNIITINTLGKPEKIRKKLRSTVAWCEFAVEEGKKKDLGGLVELLLDRTLEQYDNLLREHPELLEVEDSQNIQKLENIHKGFAPDLERELFLLDEV